MFSTYLFEAIWKFKCWPKPTAFFRTFWFGFSVEACIDCDASLIKALKFAGIFRSSNSNMIGLLVYDLCQSIGSLLVIGSISGASANLVIWWTFPALDWWWGNTPKHISSWNLCYVKFQLICARCANKIIILSLLVSYIINSTALT